MFLLWPVFQHMVTISTTARQEVKDIAPSKTTSSGIITGANEYFSHFFIFPVISTEI